MLESTMPDNLQTFLTTYLTIGSISIPYNILPDFIPNPKDMIRDFLTKPLSDRFRSAGFESLSFIYNFGDQISTWIILLLIYLTLIILTKCISKEKYQIIA